MRYIVKISLIIITILMLLTINSHAFTATTSVDNDKIQVDDDVIYKIKLDKKVIASNFDIIYDSESVELVESVTTGLNVAKKNGKIACIYVDMRQQGIDEFEIKFKALRRSKETTLSVENVKFRVVGQRQSYTLKNTQGLEEQVIEISNTSLTNLMWLSIIGIGVVIMTIVILLIVGIIMGKKQLNNSKKIMSIVLALFVLGTINSNVTAINNDIVINFSEIGEEKVVQILLPNDDIDRKVTKEEIISKNNTITSIKDENGNELANSDMVKTGDIVQTANGTSTVILFGDANKDGYICDTDDIMIIIDNYLGTMQTDDITKTAANLYNLDDMLDTDDIMQMMDMYLGSLTGEILTNPVSDNNENTEEITANHKIHIEGYSADTQQPLTSLSVSYTAKDGQVQMEYIRDDNKVDIPLNNIEQSSTNQVTLNIENGSITLKITYDDNQRIVDVTVVTSDINYSIREFSENEINLAIYI